MIAFSRGDGLTLLTSGVMSAKVLPKHFFERPVLEVTEGLLGKHLCRELGGEIVRLRVCEVEAYDGPHDKACHAARGKTARNAVMFGTAGYWYVYLCYGMHWMLNVVTGPRGYPAAVLVRGAGTWTGPGRLTRALQIGKALNGMPARRASGLWFEDDGLVPQGAQVKRTPRIGVHYAKEWAHAPYRFVWKEAEGT